MDLAEAGFELTQAEQHALARFGLALTSNSVLRMADDEGESLLPRHFGEACRLDSIPRLTSERSPPDAVLLRHTSHRSYRGTAQKAAVRALITMPPGSGLM
ncbi:hypothetical protein WDZ92_53895, partial [Nostoc sp. NIES-2111]